jgi:pimeloyl-ACP methyl ester carboxylesterase
MNMKNIKLQTPRLRVFVLAFLIFATLFSIPANASADSGGNSIKVDRVNFTVTLSGQEYIIAGYLYYQGSFRNRTLQVVVHGATYNHSYWDAPTINGHDYSYARFMARKKYAVLAIDQLGAGQSSRPDGDFVTRQQTVESLHQVLASLRAGSNPTGYAFEKIVLVGHSFGSINAIFAQAQHQDADALVTTGYGHVPHALPIPIEFIIALLTGPPYFTLPPEFRTALFYHAAGADPDVIAFDNANLADELTRGQVATTFFDIFSDPAGQVTGPVLVQLGEFDALWPSLYAGGEAAFWTSASSVTVQSLLNVGHDFNLHLDNETGWRQIDKWIAGTVGRR